MNCPECNSKKTEVLDSRPRVFGDTIRRRRICSECDHKFTTYEIKDKYLNKLEHIEKTLKQFRKLLYFDDK